MGHETQQVGGVCGIVGMVSGGGEEVKFELPIYIVGAAWKKIKLEMKTAIVELGESQL